MMAGKKEAAKKVLEHLFARLPENETIYADAVNIYMAGHCFNEAKAIFQLYKSRFGSDLRTDFSLADIEREESKHNTTEKAYDSSAVKVFKRMSPFERGRISHHPMIFPVKEIRISNDEIVLRQGWHEYHYAWSEIQEVFITTRRGYKGYQFSDDFIRTLNLRTRDRTFRIDVSVNFPDFRNSQVLLKELSSKIKVRET
jgi:hypothetical protein